MRKLIRPLTALAIASAMTLGGLGVALAQPYPPVPAPLVEAAPPAMPGPNYVWEPGHWNWNGDQYVWVGGHYVVRESAWHEFVPGHWRNDGATWVWEPGHWS